MIKATLNDKPLVIDILCQAFDANQSVNYVVKQDQKRTKRIKALMDYSFDICYRFGDIYLSDDKQACALLVYPNQQKTNLIAIILDIQLMFNCIGLNRIKKVLSRNSKIKSMYPKTPMAYLWFIGVNVKQQGKGIGSSFFKELLKLTDSLEKPVYLETSMLQNLSFYKKLGFYTYKELMFDHKLYMMKRDIT